MKLLLTGHSALDQFSDRTNKEFLPGGIYYNAESLLNCSGDDDKLYLLTGIDKNYLYYKNIYDHYDKTYCNYDCPGVKVELNVKTEGEREEKYLHMPEPLDIKNVLPDAETFDGILINFISGADINPDDAILLRNKTNAVIYADIHTLARGIDNKGNRYFRQIPDIDKWLKIFDVLQLNENELKTITGDSGEKGTAEFMLDQGCKVVIVTKGKYGARVYTRVNNELSSLFLTAAKVKEKNKVGCGDTFGAFFFYYYVTGYDLNYALRKAVDAAGKSAAGLKY